MIFLVIVVLLVQLVSRLSINTVVCYWSSQFHLYWHVCCCCFCYYRYDPSCGKILSVFWWMRFDEDFGNTEAYIIINIVLLGSLHNDGIGLPRRDVTVTLVAVRVPNASVHVGQQRKI